MRPLANLLRGRMLGWSPRTLAQVATKSWEISPAETTVSPSAIYLPDQLERVTGWEFATEHPRRQMEGGRTNTHSSTRAHLLKDAWLIDGMILKGGAGGYLRPRFGRVPRCRATLEVSHAAIYSSAGGLRYFGQWLMDDCVTYPLAASLGTPVSAVEAHVSVHAAGYRKLLGMSSVRYEDVFFRELVVFEDFGQNGSKRARFRANAQRLLTRVSAPPHPGVFILRGTDGMPRRLKNELALAEHLREKRGFRILDPLQCNVEQIVATCAGAETVIGVEGSQLIHGVLTLREDAALLTLQPPDRFVAVFKHLTDRDGQRFGFVVGLPSEDSFVVNIDEVERTLDLLHQSSLPSHGGACSGRRDADQAVPLASSQSQSPSRPTTTTTLTSTCRSGGSNSFKKGPLRINGPHP